MALDGIFLHCLQREIADGAVGDRVDKIHQPTKEEIVLTLRGRSGAKKLLLSCRPDSARVHFTDYAPENPAKPPMFTMLLRKLLQGARLDDVTQPGLERVLELHFTGTNELGDRVTYRLVIEILSRYANILLLDGNGKIIDCIRRMNGETGNRRLLPGVDYTLPPPQDKLNILTENLDAITQRLQTCGATGAKAVQSTLLGVSPIICREVEHGLTLEQLRTYALAPSPTVVLDGVPKDFAFTPIHQYGDLLECRSFDSPSALLDFFFYERVRLARIKSRSADLFHHLTTLQERAVRKAENRRQELLDCADKDKYRIYGDLITSNQYALEKGAPFYDLENYYEPGTMVRIPADPALSPSANAQKYYKDYRKKQVAEQKLTGFIAQAEAEAAYLDSVLDALSRSSTDAEISAIRAELTAGGYLRHRGKEKPAKALKPLEYQTADGFRILVGRNNVMNDKLTLKTAAGEDYWFHTQDTPGCHVVLVTAGRAPSESALHDAAVLAAYNSKARASSNVPVDYTRVKFVKKPAGAKPGRVIYTDYKTIFVTPTREETERMIQLG